MSTDATDVETLKKDLVKHKKNFTRYVNAAGRQTEFASKHPSEIAATEVQTALERVKKAYAEVIQTLDTLQDYSTDDAELLVLERNKEDTQLRYEEITERIMATMLEIKSPTTAPHAAPTPAQAAPRQATTKIIDALKPEKLSEDHNPVEFRAWKEQWRSFYNASRLDLLDHEDQLQYFKTCIDPNLYDNISAGIDRNTRLFGAGGCMDILSTEFNEIYPLATRRTAYFRLNQEKDAPFSAFARQLKKIGNEADLQNIQVDELHAFRYITGCQDRKLRTKFLEVETPTLAEFDRIVRAHERSQATSKNLDGSEKPAAVAQIKKTPNTNNPKKICAGCGGSWHDKRSNCPNFNATCNFCKKKGHTEAVCIGKKRATQQIPGNPPTQQANSNSRNTVKVARNEATDDLTSSDSDDETQATTSRISHGSEMYRVSIASTSKTQYCKDTPRLRVKFTTKTTSFNYRTLPDTGATRSIISKDLAEKHNLKIKQSTNRLFAADNSELACEGYTNIKAENLKITPLISSSLNNEIIICWHDLVNLGVLPGTFPQLPPTTNHIANNLKTTDNKEPTPKHANNNARKPDLHSLFDEFNDILSDDLPEEPMNGPRMTIELDSLVTAKPKKVYAARAVPIHYEKEARALIDRLVAEDIIEPVHEDTCEWISPAFFVPKSNGKLRLVTDFTHLNKFVQRPVHPFPSANEIMQRIPSNAKVFAKMDAVQGYHQVELDENSRHFTTFLLPWGKYRYKRGPMGLKSTSDIFCAKSDKAILGVEDTQKIVDDILICAPDYNELHRRIKQVLNNCRELNITISKKKLAIGETIDFAGFTISPNGVTPDQSKIEALAKFPPPNNLHELRSFLGLANQLGGFVEHLTTATDPLRQLLKKGATYKWTGDLQTAFDNAIKILTSPAVVNFFDPELPTLLLSDASNLHGLGFALTQTNKDGTTKLIQCGSRSLTDAETRYAPVELECLGILWATEKCRHYLLGNPNYTVITDHNPLLGVFKKDIPAIDNKRLQRFRERLQPYNFELKWTEGKKHLIADAFSRKPIGKAEETSRVSHVSSFPLAVKPILMQAVQHDEEYIEIRKAIKEHKNINDLPLTTPPSH